jgi:hypothetical protein
MTWWTHAEKIRIPQCLASFTDIRIESCYSSRINVQSIADTAPGGDWWGAMSGPSHKEILRR